MALVKNANDGYKLYKCPPLPVTYFKTYFLGLHYIQPNERGEYEIADGTSAATFRAILEYYQENYLSTSTFILSFFITKH